MYAIMSCDAASDDLRVPDAFQVLGFSVTGRVVDRSGRGVADAVIKVNSFEKATTDKDGYYKLDQMTAGKHSIKVRLTYPMCFCLCFRRVVLEWEAFELA